jgi:serine/threonine protein kinase
VTDQNRTNPQQRHADGDTTIVSTQSGAERTYLPGDIVDGAYQLTALLGRGGMGVVFACKHLVMGKTYAIKILSGEDLSDEYWNRFRAEAQALAKLNHPNIVGIYNMGVDAGHFPYFVMDLLTGHTLDVLVAEKGPLAVNETLDIFIRVADALGSSHAQGIIHRDVKPSNIMLVPDQNNQMTGVKLVDFGIARLAKDALAAQSQTKTGMIFGTPFYMSPEQCQGKKVDERTDIYSMGCALFECLTGKPPFCGDNHFQTFMMHQTEPPPQLIDIAPNGNFPQAMEAAVAKMLAKNSAERYQTMAQVKHDLERIRAGKLILREGLSSAFAPGLSDAFEPGRSNTLPPGRSNTLPPGRSNTLPPGRSNTLPPGRSNTLPPGRSNTLSPSPGHAGTSGSTGKNTLGRGNTNAPGRANTGAPGLSNANAPGPGTTNTPGGGNSRSPGQSNTSDALGRNTTAPDLVASSLADMRSQEEARQRDNDIDSLEKGGWLPKKTLITLIAAAFIVVSSAVSYLMFKTNERPKKAAKAKVVSTTAVDKNATSDLPSCEMFIEGHFEDYYADACRLSKVNLKYRESQTLPPAPFKQNGSNPGFLFPKDFYLATIRFGGDAPFMALGFVPVPKDKPVYLYLRLDSRDWPGILDKFGPDDLTGLELVTLRPQQVVAKVKHWHKLKELSFFNTLVQAPANKLELDQSVLNDPDLPAVDKLTQLQSLGLAGSSLTSDAILKMHLLDKVKTLKLKSIKNVDHLLRGLSAKDNLEELWLVNEEISNEQLEPLTKMKNLKTLRIRRSPLTADSLPYFKRMKALKHLTLDTQWWDSDQARFVRTLPDCKFESPTEYKYWKMFPGQKVTP